MTLGYYRMQAHKHLCDEVFSCINREINEAFAALARENSKARGCNATHFMYRGVIYPEYPKQGNNCMLHVSLYDAFDQINNQETGKEDIKNFFSAVLTASANGIVLDTLLPTVLVNSLKKSLAEGYQSIDVPRLEKWVSIETTRQDIIAIQNHYAKTIGRLREIMMEKLLLQG